LVYGFCWQFFSFCLAFCHFPAVSHPLPGSVPGLVVRFFPVCFTCLCSFQRTENQRPGL